MCLFQYSRCLYTLAQNFREYKHVRKGHLPDIPSIQEAIPQPVAHVECLEQSTVVSEVQKPEKAASEDASKRRRSKRRQVIKLVNLVIIFILGFVSYS